MTFALLGVRRSSRSCRYLASGTAASGVSVRCSLGANTAVVDKCSICSSMDAFIRKLYDRPFNGKYVLIQRLGKGGFGVVYLGTRPACVFRTQR